MLTEKKIEGLEFKYRQTQGEFIILMPQTKKALIISWAVATALYKFKGFMDINEPSLFIRDAPDLFLFKYSEGLYTIAHFGIVFVLTRAQIDEFLLFVLEISIAIADEKGLIKNREKIPKQLSRDK